MPQQRLGLLIGGAISAGMGVLLLVGGFVAFSLLVAAVGATISAGDGTIPVLAMLIGATAAVLGVVLLLLALFRQRRG